MTARCTRCGAELLPGMRFCRFCGAPTGAVSIQEQPTRPFPGDATMPQSAPSATQPVYAPPAPPAPYADIPLEKPPRRRWPWVLGAVILTAGLILGGIGYGIYRLTTLPGVQITETDQGIEITKDGKRIVHINAGDAIKVEHSGEVVTRTIPLAAGGSFSISADVGDVKLTTWDQDAVFIEAKKHLGSREDKAQLDMEIDTSDASHVIVRTKRPEGSEAHLDYEVKLPRNVIVKHVQTVRGDIELLGVYQQVTAEAVAGDIVAKEFSGVISAKTVNGTINLELSPPAQPVPMKIESVAGDVTIRFLDGYNADVDVSSLRGAIDHRGSGIELNVKRDFARVTARGRVGQGGPPEIRIQTVTGDIKLSR